MIKNKKVKHTLRKGINTPRKGIKEISHYVFFRKSRKGSHVSFIISFILFIIFLIFFVSILNPFERVETGKSSLLKHLENEIVKETSGKVMVVSVLEDITSGCGDIDALNIKKYAIKQEANFLKIYSSNKFASSNFLCDPAQNGYKIGLVRTQNYAFQSEFLKLNDSYNKNYENLKRIFGIPEANDFEFSFLDDSKISITEAKFKKETPQAEVLAEIIPITYFAEDSEIKNGYIRVVLW